MPCLVFKDRKGRRFEVAIDKPRLSVGREAGNDVVIPFRSVSRQHCVFESRDGGVWVEDVGSSNGSTLNDEPLTEACLFDRGRPVVVCGDWCGGPRVEGAYLSGAAAAGRILGTLRSRRQPVQGELFGAATAGASPPPRVPDAGENQDFRHERSGNG